MWHLDQVTERDALIVGDEAAPLRVVEYTNARCPDAERYEREIAPLLAPYIEKGQVKRVLKACAFPRGIFPLGAVIDRYLPYDEPARAYQLLRDFQLRLDSWRDLQTEQEVAMFAQAHGLTELAGWQERQQRVLAEAAAVGITHTPTVIVGDTVFVETIEPEEFMTAIDAVLHNMQ